MNRSLSIDILKIILAILVVAIHSGFLTDISALGRYLTTAGLFRIAVPIFFVINGFFFFSLPPAKITTWFKRVIILYLFWTLVYIGYWFRAETLNLFEIVRVVKTILVGHEHLWYLPAMIGAALVLLPLRNLPTPLLLIIVLVLYAIGLSIQYLGNYHIVANPSIDKALNSHFVYRNFLFFAFPFFAIGYLLKRTEIYKQFSVSSVVYMTLFATILLLVESYLNFKYQMTSKGFDIFLFLILVCPLVFITALKVDIRGESKTLALYSTGIYFIHPLFISIIKNYVEIGGTLLTLVVAIVSALASWLLIKINTKVKFIL
ncbi:MAG: acyltransferase family protein [Cellvibrio sp.]